MNHIGELNEQHLNAALKAWFAGPDYRVEASVSEYSHRSTYGSRQKQPNRQTTWATAAENDDLRTVFPKTHNRMDNLVLFSLLKNPLIHRGQRKKHHLPNDGASIKKELDGQFMITSWA